MLNVEQTARSAPVNDLVERVPLSRVGAGVEGHILGREIAAIFSAGRTVAAGFVFDILVGGAAVLDGRQWGRAVGRGRGGRIGGGGCPSNRGSEPASSESGMKKFRISVELGPARVERNGWV